MLERENKPMISNSKRLPAIFIPHGGGPCFFMDWTWGPPDTWHRTRQFLEGLAGSLSAPPKAIVVVSGHWEEKAFTASTAAEPALIFDYSGFPEHTYHLTWPAPGEPDLAKRVAGLLQAARLPTATSATRGFDHGVFVPLKVAFPEAKIPVVTLSLAESLDSALHLAAGRALAPLRDEGVLIVASGMSFHNQRAYFGPQTGERARAFDEWLTKAVESPSAERDALLKDWHNAPFGAYAHPREEHLIPLLVAAGAGGNAPGKRIFSDEPMGAAISAFRFDG
jgi:aromatic ring-opening dioxygenase catalytic subunit (LigB family)